MVGRCRTGFFFEVHAMKKTIFEHFGFWLRGVVCGALLLSAAVACSDDNDDPGAAAPEITLESVSTGQTEFRSACGRMWTGRTVISRETDAE